MLSLVKHRSYWWAKKDLLTIVWLLCESRSVVSNSWWPHGLYSLWNPPDQNTGVGSHSLLQGIFPTQGSNPGLPHCRRIFYQLSHQGSPRILEWVAYPSPGDLPKPGIELGVSCTAGRFFTSWATREAQKPKVVTLVMFKSLKP